MDDDNYIILLKERIRSLERELEFEIKRRQCEIEGHKNVSWVGKHSYYLDGKLQTIETGFCHYCCMPTGRPLPDL